MKKTITILAILLAAGGTAYAQNLAKAEAKSLSTFLSMPAAKGGTNAEALRMTGQNPASCPGIKIENGHVVEIDWSKHNLAGTLDLTAFTSLTNVNVSDNKLTAILSQSSMWLPI